MARDQAVGSLTGPRHPATDSPEETAIAPPRRPASWPSVTVIVPTRDRPVMLARAVRSIIGQSYPGEIECAIVFDQSDPAEVSVEMPAGRRVRLLTNTRTPGAAGARNTGIMTSDAPVVAFCDDDDAWDANKLRSVSSRAVCVFTTLTARSTGWRPTRLACRSLSADVIPSSCLRPSSCGEMP
jgi:glycosyltransferase involved in cell wall biosynthesis